MEKAIKIAKKSGWKPKDGWHFTDESMFGIKNIIWIPAEICLDPLFWQALGKGLGWTWEGEHETGIPAWNRVWHSFIDHLAEGKNINSFFEELTN